MRMWALLLVVLGGCGARSEVVFDEGGGETAAVCLGIPGEAVALSEANPFRPIAVDGTHVYFSQTLSPDAPPQARLARIPIAGGDPEPIVSGYIAEMVLSGPHVVFVQNPTGNSFELLRVLRAGGVPETLATGVGEPTSLTATADGSVLLTTRYGQGGPEGLWRWKPGETLTLVASFPEAIEGAASTDAAYVVHRSAGDKRALTRVRLSDGSPTLLLDDVPYSSSLSLDGEELFSAANFQVDRFTLGPSSASLTTLAKVTGALAEVAVDASHVYVADIGVYHDDLPPPKPKDIPGSIGRVPRQGGDLEVLSEEGRNVGSVAVDACHVYWTSKRGLVRMRKP